MPVDVVFSFQHFPERHHIIEITTAALLAAGFRVTVALVRSSLVFQIIEPMA